MTVGGIWLIMNINLLKDKGDITVSWLKKILIFPVVLILLGALGTVTVFYFRSTQPIVIDNVRYPRDLTRLDLSGSPVDRPAEIPRLTALEWLDVRNTGMGAADYEMLRSALPNCTILWQPCIQGDYYGTDTRRLTLTDLTEADLAAAAYLPKLEWVDAGNCEEYALLKTLQAQHPDCQINYSVEAGGKSYANTVTRIQAEDLTEEDARLLLEFLPQLESLSLTGVLPSRQSLDDMVRAYPHVAITWQVTLGDVTLAMDAVDADLTGRILPVQEVEAAIAYLSDLTRMNLTGCGISEEEIRVLDSRYPQIRFVWGVELAGHLFPNDAQELDLSGIPMTTEQIEAVLPSFPKLRKVIMSHCGIPNEEMDALNRRYEQIQFVWTIYIKHVPVRTDVTWFMPYRLNIKVTDKDLADLRYCTEIVCMDLGHMDITRCDFVAYMPHLKYLILADSRVADISPLRGLKELVYLEIFMTQVRDLSPLVECTALVDLNLCWTFGDPGPIARMTWLENLWWGGRKHLTYAEKQMLREALPNTHMELGYIASTDAGWRKLPNYYAMRDALGMWYMD